jgi:hypothetical protein
MVVPAAAVAPEVEVAGSAVAPAGKVAVVAPAVALEGPAALEEVAAAAAHYADTKPLGCHCL